MVGIAEGIPLGDNSVDVVLCNQVLEHVIDPGKSVSEIFRILKPGGRFLGSVPHVSPIHLEPYDFRRYTAIGVEQLLRQAGFSQISVEGNGGVFSTAALMISMDILLSKRTADKPQKFNTKLSLLLFPIIGFLNLAGLFSDSLFGNKGRTPANLCWEASKALP
jgi:SAM-dependent methyltransferase